MNKTMYYSHLESVLITLTLDDVARLLREGGHVPDDFKIDLDDCEGDWPIALKFSRTTTSDSAEAAK